MIAYFDCFSGISGDMIAGAFIDAGVPFEWLRGELGKLPLDGYTLEARDVQRGGIGGKRFKVNVPASQPARTLREIRGIIRGAPIADDAKELSLKVFERLASAEAGIHRIEADEVHFHEVGAVDSIIDIVAASLSVSYLKIDRIYSSTIPLTGGAVSCDHGTLPLPAPATMELLKGVPVYMTNDSGENVTPTGAAFLTAVCDGYGVFPPMRIKATGYGAGERENGRLPNLLRIVIGEGGSSTTGQGLAKLTDSVTVIEANIDDMNPEHYGYLMEGLFERGALDVSYLPVYMKKSRPGTLVQVISPIGGEEKIIDFLMKETSTIGVRFSRVDRLKLERESKEVMTSFGNVRLKVASTPWGDKASPEYEDCRKIAISRGIPIWKVYREALKEYERVVHD